jgi:hypothetical protein
VDEAVVIAAARVEDLEVGEVVTVEEEEGDSQEAEIVEVGEVFQEVVVEVSFYIPAELAIIQWRVLQLFLVSIWYANSGDKSSWPEGKEVEVIEVDEELVAAHREEEEAEELKVVQRLLSYVRQFRISKANPNKNRNPIAMQASL